MSKDYSFSVMPSVSISRSRFARKSQHKTSFNLGEIVPIYVDEVLPGDTRSLDLASLVRMSTPIAPIMDNIHLDLYAFFVPNRLVWEHWKEFAGENNESAGIPSTEYLIPYLGDNNSGNPVGVNSLCDYMGLPVGVNDIFVQNKVSALPFRAYYLIYNEWFRNQNVEAPLAIQIGDTNEVIVGELSDDDYCSSVVDGSLLTAYKFPDYFTCALPYAQKGTAVSIPLGSTAPVIASGDTVFEGAVTGATGSISAPSSSLSSLSYGNAQVYGLSGTFNAGEKMNYSSGLVADLTTATAATINELRYAFQLQKFLERDSIYGSRYWELLASHFGVTAPDASLQRPEYLGGKRVHINIDQVLSQAGYSADDTTTVGAPGANSVTGWKGSLFTKSFTEHGTLMIMAVARHESTYGQGINRMWTRQSRYDFYWPVFANLGAQTILNKEIYAQGTSDDDEVFGYQEAWAEYRYKPSLATGLLRPSASGSLDYWTLGEDLSSLPTLSTSFLKQGRTNLARSLVTGATGPDFIADFFFIDTAVRPMPMYSIPGLIDHH